MTDQTSAQDGFDVTFFLRLLLGVGGILGTAIYLFDAMLTASNFPPSDELPTRAAILSGDRALIRAAVIVAGAPLAALVLAWLVHNRGAVKRWTVAFVIGLIAAGLILDSRHDYLHQCLLTATEDRLGKHCVEYTDAWRYASSGYVDGASALVANARSSMERVA
ncbi:hypothetical protein [Pseudofrankia sp. BMG5.37]|uniref:hypothetical protein n=1 Tax=Pseudofrankia sp. BMG5.37 TaxID=3050035 RepID=UPI002894AB54|nr:hypothetical protein [Pseudofrankia sp. BMG5.37]MDT3441629.1 hypothetical protein [Pseudofrankia sp. BMG5.37]